MKNLAEYSMHSVHSISTTPAPNEQVVINTVDIVQGLSSVATPSTVAS